MIVIGLCGRSGSGKSTVASFFHSYGFPVIDTDLLYHEILLEKDACTQELTDAFGKEILDEEGFINRRKLASCVFMTNHAEEKQKQLNAITHKHVLDRVNSLIEAYRQNGARAVFVDVPLLYESGFDRNCQYVIAVVADEKLRIHRLCQRDGLSSEEIQARVNSQVNDDYLKAHADFCIENNGDREGLYDRAEKILQILKLGEK